MAAQTPTSQPGRSHSPAHPILDAKWYITRMHFLTWKDLTIGVGSSARKAGPGTGTKAGAKAGGGCRINPIDAVVSCLLACESGHRDSTNRGTKDVELRERFPGLD